MHTHSHRAPGLKLESPIPCHAAHSRDIGDIWCFRLKAGRLKRRDFVALIAGGVIATPTIGQAQTPHMDRPLDVGLIFVGASWCAQCHMAAPLIRIAALNNDLPLLVASADDKAIPPFEHFAPASTHPIAQQVRAYPSLLIWSSAENRIVARIDGIRSPRGYIARLNATLKSLREQGYVR